jgi:hypothetical protein
MTPDVMEKPLIEKGEEENGEEETRTLITQKNAFEKNQVPFFIINISVS